MRWTALFAVALAAAALPAVEDREIFASPDPRGAIVRVQPFPFNRLADAALASATGTDPLPIPQWFSVAGATDATPIVLSTWIPHGLSEDEAVVVKGVEGNTGANGFWRVHVLDPSSFVLVGSSGNAAYAGGGSIFPMAGQPRPPGPRNAAGEFLWTPWFSNPAAFDPTEFFSSDGQSGTGEVTTLPASPGDSFLAQEVDGSLFSSGEQLWLSVECRMPQPYLGVGVQSLRFLVTAVWGNVTTYSVSFPASAMTVSYQRFAMTFTLPARPMPPGSLLRVEIQNQVGNGPPLRMDWARPMLHAGSTPAPWTSDVGPVARSHDFYVPPS